MYKDYNTIEYIAEQPNDVLFDILLLIDKQLNDKKDNALQIIRDKIIFIIKTRCDK